ncbi:MAG: response regulator [Candidatus Hydrogenedentes bacterium]|nr:response regulator [Candidatus Hydrogenedentota bacterium]
MDVSDQAGTRPQILVVDDREENVLLLQQLLNAKGYDVYGASSGEAALKAVLQSPPDAVLLDLVLPEMSGYEVCRRLKQNVKTQHIPVVIITGTAEREANIRALDAGADDFLIKPLDSVLLEARIRNSLNAKALHDQILRYQRLLEESNAQLELRIHERTTQLERTQQVAVFSLAKLAECRDTDTGEHLNRMRLYARELALELATWPQFREVIDAQFIDNLYQSSPLHDIGKVGIPDRILLKPGKLTPFEFEIMKTHAALGGDTLKAAEAEAGEHSFLAMGRDIAYFHHERWDGTGYPTRLGGAGIPLPARVVALGDVYDALTTKRPYKAAFPHEHARSLIIEARGSHLDPDIVDAFLARERRFIEIQRSLDDSDKLSRLEVMVRKLDSASQK